MEQILKTILNDARSDQKQMKETTKFAWEISPQLAVHMASRLMRIFGLSYNYKLICAHCYQGSYLCAYFLFLRSGKCLNFLQNFFYIFTYEFFLLFYRFLMKCSWRILLSNAYLLYFCF